VAAIIPVVSTIRRQQLSDFLEFEPQRRRIEGARRGMRGGG